jgi:hypothetical protein
MADAARLSYVLPLRWGDDSGLDELAAYLRELAEIVAEVVVVDGSEDQLFDRHAAAFGDGVRHIRPDPELDHAMGKVNGVITGVLAASCELVVIADDDVRYDRASLARVAELLGSAHLVRPQNYFDPLPWHARIDTARTLLNRLYTGDLEFPAGDFPGTLAVRRDAFEAIGGYDGGVMFENFELMRTMKAAGGIVASPLDLFVRRLPPDTPHYLGQRVRQAFDDLGIPQRLAFFLALAPAFASLRLSGRRRSAAVSAAIPIAAAEAGRRRARGTRVYPVGSSLLAPLWVAERAVTSWLAVWSKLRRGGIPYAGKVVPRGVNSPRTLRRRLAGVRLPPPGGAEADDLVGAVAERRVPRSPAAADRDRVTP